jgi:hypothetical protein
MNKWVMKKKPELVPVPIDPTIYQQKILEIANALYKTVTASSIHCPIPTRPVLPTIRGDEGSHP